MFKVVMVLLMVVLWAFMIIKKEDMISYGGTDGYWCLKAMAIMVTVAGLFCVLFL